jgi:class 3 adenylate cyclase
MRLTIGNRIFAIAASMTLMMALAAIVSSYFMDNANGEFRRVAKTYIPLSNAMEEIQDHAKELKLLFHWVLPPLLARDAAAPMDPILKKLQEMYLNDHVEYQSALQLLLLAQKEEQVVEFKVELARLTVQMEQVVNLHIALQKQTFTILDQLAKGEVPDVDVVSAIRLQLEQQINVVKNEIDSLTNQAYGQATVNGVWAFRANMVAMASTALFGLILAGFISRGLVRPLQDLESAVREVKNGNLAPQIEVRSSDEIGNLTYAFKEMSAELRTKEQIKDTFGKYVDPRIVEQLTVGEDAGLGDGERRIYSVFFSDIAGFTGISEMLTPKSLVNLINAYLSEMSIPIQESSGVIDKYIGDAIMAYWGPPFTSVEDHAQAACRAALEQQTRLIEFRKRVGEITGLRRGYPDVSMRIGIATGEVLVGSVGSERARNYTVIGNTVNLAGRLESLGKHYGTDILISEETWDAVRDDFELREIDTIAVAGKTESSRIFELLATKGDLTPEQSARRDSFAAALEVYRAGDWPAARRALENYLAQDAGDGPAQVMLDRLEGLEATASDEWDGVWHFTQK